MITLAAYDKIIIARPDKLLYNNVLKGINMFTLIDIVVLDMHCAQHTELHSHILQLQCTMMPQKPEQHA